MAYNCLFTILSDKDLVEPTLTHAIAAARAYDAHLDILCMGVDRTQTGYHYTGADLVILQETINLASTEAHEIETLTHEMMKGAGIRWGSEIGVTQIADRVRFSDLVILPRPYGDGRGAELEPITEAALFQGHTPALLVPEQARPKPRPDRVLLGWNESIEALITARAALDLMSTAETVHIAVIDPPKRGPYRSDPGGMLSQYLARHGIKAEINVLSKSQPRVSDVLLGHADDMKADLLVMGAYGHSRFRETIFGGVTRDILENATLPVLMAH